MERNSILSYMYIACVVSSTIYIFGLQFNTANFDKV
jgi:hypothetical protein